MPKYAYNAARDKNTQISVPQTKARTSRSEPMILKLFQLAFKIGGWLSPKITSRFAYRLWLTSPRFKTPVSEHDSLKSAIVEFHSIKNHKIASYIWGRSKPTAKPTVLLVHGWSGRGTQLGSFVEPLLDAGYRVLSFDAPAHGKSSGKQTTIYEIADVILALEQHYNGFVAVISHSFGGPCTALAIKKGLNIKHFVAICPPASLRELVTKFIHTLHINNKTSAQLINHIEGFFGTDVWQQLSMTTLVKNINIPGFVIHDKHDTDIPLEEGRAVAKAWHDAPLKITDGLGHRRILRDDDVIKSAIDFIADKKL